MGHIARGESGGLYSVQLSQVRHANGIQGPCMDANKRYGAHVTWDRA